MYVYFASCQFLRHQKKYSKNLNEIHCISVLINANAAENSCRIFSKNKKTGDVAWLSMRKQPTIDSRIKTSIGPMTAFNNEPGSKP